MNKKLMAKAVAATPLLVGAEGYSDVVLNAMGATPTKGFTFGGNKKRLISIIEEDRHRENGVSASKSKGKRGLKNLECPINFEAKGSCSNQGNGKIALRV
jgi:hypothetical protein